jgi:hypothetical protein
MHQENEGTRHAGSHRNQLDHRTHPATLPYAASREPSHLTMLRGKMFSARPDDGGTWQPPVTNWQRGCGPALSFSQNRCYPRRRRMRRRVRQRVLTSVRTAARNFDLLLAIATPSTSVPGFSRGWNDSDSVWRQQGGLCSRSGRLDCGRMTGWKMGRLWRIFRGWRRLFNAIAAPSTDALKRSSWNRIRVMQSARSAVPR